VTTLRALTLALLVALPLRAQAPPTDTLTLPLLQRLAEQQDPRAGRAALFAQQSALRRHTLRNERLPALSALGMGQYLSDVPSVPGAPFPPPLAQQYDAYVAAKHTLFDGTRSGRLALEDAQLAEAQAALRGTLWQQRSAVTEAYFSVLLRQAQGDVLRAAIADLTARAQQAQVRIDAGAALPSELSLLDAERQRREQLLRESETEARAARHVLSALTGLPIDSATVLRTPVVTGMAAATAERTRPEFAQFDASRELISVQQQVLAAQRLPKVSLVGRAGYGRPGLNQLGRDFDSYYVAGLQVEWNPWDWGAARRAQQERSLHAQVVDLHEAAFTAALARGALRDQARIAALQDALAADQRIAALRESVLAEARLRYDEGDITTADYVARFTEAVSARLDRDTRRVQLAEAQARYLTTLGREVR
jgi:outer membrane protein TolC